MRANLQPVSGSGIPEVVLLTPCGAGRVLAASGELEPFPTRLRVRSDQDGGLQVEPRSDGPADRLEVDLDLACDLVDLAELEPFEDLLEPWVDLLQAGEVPLPPPRPLLMVLPYGAFPRAARRIRRWAVGRLRRPLLLAAEPLAWLALHVEALAGQAPPAGEGSRTMWLPGPLGDPRGLQVRLTREALPRATLLGLGPDPEAPPSASAASSPPELRDAGLARGAARLAGWLFARPGPVELRLLACPQLQICEAHRRGPLAAWQLGEPQEPFLKSLDLRLRTAGPTSLQVRAWLGPGRGDSSVLVELPVCEPVRLEIRIQDGQGNLAWTCMGRDEGTHQVPFALPELLA